MTDTRSSRREVWSGAGVLLLLLLGYMLFWWNRGIQLNSNGLPTLAARQILAGKAPYLDFYFWCPPGHLLVYAALSALFGDGLIYVRAFAVIERMAIFMLVYFWLTRIFSARAAFFGTLVAGVGFSSDIADVLAHYDFDAVLTSVAAGFAAALAMTSTGSRRGLMCFVAGVCAGASMVVKQTQGVGMLLLLLIVFALGKHSGGISARALMILEYLAGWAVPTGLVAWWLIRAGAWEAFIQQSFVKGTSSKGSLWEILLRPVSTLAYEHVLLAALIAAIALMILFVWKSGPEVAADGPAQWQFWLAGFSALILAFASAWWLPAVGAHWRVQQAFIAISAVCVFMSMYGNAALALKYTLDAVRDHLDGNGIDRWVMASVSAMTAYMFSLSWTAYEKMLIPGFAFLMAMAIDRQLKRGWKLPGYAVVALGLLLIVTAGFRKLTLPYGWMNWIDGPIEEETAASDFPEMRGLRVTPQAADFLARVTQIIDSHSTPDEKIFCYPNYTLFYVLAHRDPAVFAYMHWFDIASDDLARQDALRIQTHPPAVILMVDLPEPVIAGAERRFRGGRKSGQRDLVAAIQSLPGYRVIETVPIPYLDYGLKIYARQ